MKNLVRNRSVGLAMCLIVLAACVAGCASTELDRSMEEP